ncbi:MAG: hypothetical protein O2858_02020 [Proteobacteria bacterium]|nr:hypothetical protein [Pseudomonadota bacterium]
MRMKQAQQTVSMASGAAIAAEGVAASLDLDSQDSIELAVTAILAGISSIAGAKEP